MNKYVTTNSNSDRLVWNYKRILYISVLPLLVILSVLLLVLWLNDGTLSRTGYWKIQVDWFLSINQYLSNYPSLWLNLTHLGDARILLPILSFIIILRPQAWAAIFGAVPVAVLLSNGGKKLMAMPRPASVLDHDSFHIVGSAINAHTSLPSGHSTTYFTAVTAILAVFILHSKRSSGNYLLIMFGFVLASILAISRIAVGAHWPLDIIVGAACGFSAGITGVILTQRYKKWWQWLEDRKYQYFMAIFILILSISAMYRAIVAPANDQGIHVFYIAAIIGGIVSVYLLSRRLFNQLP